MELTFNQFSKINLDRCQSVKGFNHKIDDWSTSDWLTAVTGELGEAANIVKKLNRVRDGIKGNKETAEELVIMLADEIADTFIYLDLFATSVGFNMQDIVRRKFDNTSEKIGYPKKLT